MKILLLSDLHLDHGKELKTALEDGRRIDDGADVVVLAGDIDEGPMGITWAAKAFRKPVVYVAGNHEHYGRVYEENLIEMRRAAAEAGVLFLEQDEALIGGVRFLGATLWTDFDIFGAAKRQSSMIEAAWQINDFKQIRVVEGEGGRFWPMTARGVHLKTVDWLQKQLKEGDPSRTVVVTHHAPHWMSVDAQYANDLSTGAFASDLSRLMGNSCLWLHGHVHHSNNYTVSGTRVVSNPRGYGRWTGDWENGLFDSGLLLDV